ncbi:unnamed protein product [Dovyalis caffra]|uniref:Myb/SANT-like domain-containing protein n=1 Tax=Dovyalis caffra TaxID=77055 RepID=A0AAV1R8T9_9ROSI|nr:unnamed protein product [Dovyalis caffra]
MIQNCGNNNNDNGKEKCKYMAWTSEMDRCLAKTLADQIKSGNHKTVAYGAAFTAINEKFGLVLGREHVRNRLKTWKKQFGILKEMLNHKGFVWDEEQKMIVADDSVWNEYSKVHPDARYFRARFIENYDELCVVIGNDQLIGGSSDNGAEIDVDWMGNRDGVENGCVAEFQNDDRQNKKLRWTEGMDLLLGKIFAEQVRKGNKIENIIQREMYDYALSALNGKFGPELGKNHIRNRLKTWKKQHGILKEILSCPGFRWDETQKMIIANDSVWNDYLKVHPDARLFHGKVIETYDHLCLIFGKYNEAAQSVDVSPSQGGKVKDKVRNMMWTNEMDHYLSKVLVEQVRIGNKNKQDNKLKSAAYVAAVSSLNGRFQLSLTKDHVRNRLKTWRKQYDILKELLDHGDFKWDVTRKMVIANDHAWNQFIRRHPDARQFQSRVIDNYEELCIIMGCDDPPESSLNGDDVDLNLIADNDTVDTEDAFYKLLLEQVMLGNKVGKNFKGAAYRAALTVLNEKFALELTKGNIINRLRTWKKQYGLVKELLAHGGFEWDGKQKMVMASDSKWKEYIKRNPDAKHLRAKTIENFNELHIIVGHEHPNGNGSETGANVVEDPIQSNEELMEIPLHVLVDEDTRHDVGDDYQESSQQTRARPSSSSHSEQPYKRRRDNNVMMEMMSAIATDVGRIADALTEMNNVCLDEVFEMVMRIPGFDDDIIIEACEYLSFDDKRARMFMKLNDRLRKKWLLKRLRGQASKHMIESAHNLKHLVHAKDSPFAISNGTVEGTSLLLRGL